MAIDNQNNYFYNFIQTVDKLSELDTKVVINKGSCILKSPDVQVQNADYLAFITQCI